MDINLCESKTPDTSNLEDIMAITALGVSRAVPESTQQHQLRISFADKTPNEKRKILTSCVSKLNRVNTLRLFRYITTILPEEQFSIHSHGSSIDLDVVDDDRIENIVNVFISLH